MKERREGDFSTRVLFAEPVPSEKKHARGVCVCVCACRHVGVCTCIDVDSLAFLLWGIRSQLGMGGMAPALVGRVGGDGQDRRNEAS